MTLAEKLPIASLGSALAGLLFGAGWYVWIDGCAWASHVHGYQVNGVYWVRARRGTRELRAAREPPARVPHRIALPHMPCPLRAPLNTAPVAGSCRGCFRRCPS